ncbi:squalene--hopene cyclase [Sutcliffiella rhizosphaerae]|uniref:Sporulenol synthase n=1 Tax=Sutcliffiella rhizosphaerae TaxID=2880967 RepID=A0ABM8YR80_9BACI|nr:squalene--hopene cyclase [Sutcliffiella rhizosphaerae]CAG9622501.1 Sporulenol synthase [Sutcliffiella rhizosphaerae]
MTIINEVNDKIQLLVNELLQKQTVKGSWNFCFEGTVMTDAYMIILIRVLQIKNEEELVKKLVHQIIARQEKETGVWKIFSDEKEGNVNATIEGYYSLLYSGYVSRNEPLMKKAENYIRRKGGLTKSDWLTRVMLALTGQISWPAIIRSIPIEIMLLPKWAPVNIYHLVGYARVHWVPIIICSNKNSSFTTSKTPDISHLQTRTRDEDPSDGIRIIHHFVNSFVQKLADAPETLRKKSYSKAEAYIKNRIEENGILYSYFSASFFMVFAFLSLGYDRNHPSIQKAFQGMKSYIFQDKDFIHVQNSPSTVWDTSLLTAAMLQAGVPKNHEAIQNARNYILSRQQTKYGDWSLKNQNVQPGGWGFSDINTMIPDVDDTTAALRVVTPFVELDAKYKNAWERGITWLLSMQNDDGGWAAFEKNTDNYLLFLIPFKYEDRVLFDPSTADLTGRTMYFLGKYTTVSPHSKAIRHSKEWLLKNQKADGSWYGRWGNCYIYGTWAAVTGMTAIGETRQSPSLQKGVEWLYSIQNEDGGWGESCQSDWNQKYVPLHASTPSHTAWALDALIAASDESSPGIEMGIRTLLHLLKSDDWRIKYPTGAGIPGGFYIRYHSYNYIWPLQTLSHYRNKFGGK